MERDRFGGRNIGSSRITLRREVWSSEDAKGDPDNSAWTTGGEGAHRSSCPLAPYGVLRLGVRESEGRAAQGIETAPARVAAGREGRRPGTSDMAPVPPYPFVAPQRSSGAGQ